MAEEELGKKIIEARSWTAKKFEQATMFYSEVLSKISEGYLRGRRFKTEIICDPEKDIFTMIIAEYGEEDTPEEFEKYFEVFPYYWNHRKTQSNDQETGGRQ